MRMQSSQLYHQPNRLKKKRKAFKKKFRPSMNFLEDPKTFWTQNRPENNIIVVDIQERGFSNFCI